MLDHDNTYEGLTADDMYEYEDSRATVDMVYCRRCTNPIHWNDYAAYEQCWQHTGGIVRPFHRRADKPGLISKYGVSIYQAGE